MSKDHETGSSMESEPELIPDIYQYCDRWCERCAFTSRCLQFRIESEEREIDAVLQDLEVFDVRFWEDMGEALVQAMRLIREIAASEGMGDQEIERETMLSEPPESFQKSAREYPCAIAALVYAGMVNEWFALFDDNALDDALQPGDRHPALEEHLQIIRYYQYFIYPKIVRAVEGRMNDRAAGEGEVQGDASGTAKITLIAIDRSLAAWSLLYGYYPDREDSTLSILLHLDRLRRSIEVLFPAARAFIRPGFD